MKQNSRRSQRLAGALYIILPWTQIVQEGGQSRPPLQKTSLTAPYQGKPLRRCHRPLRKPKRAPAKRSRCFRISAGTMSRGGTLPRTKKQSTGLFFAVCGPPSCSSPISIENLPAPTRGLGDFGADGGTRTRTPVRTRDFPATPYCYGRAGRVVVWTMSSPCRLTGLGGWYIVSTHLQRMLR